MTKYCKTCALANLKLLRCRRFGHDINPNKDFCSKHASEIPTCEICGQEMLKENSVLDFKNGDHISIICGKCNSMMGTCALCVKSQFCSFETDPSPLPKVIQKQVRQGNMVALTQIVNPERVKITCANGCDCYDSEIGCLRQFNTCGKCESI